jgi:NAD(P)-dependent dehydrogenase (short-subunit alcohol dehydrogenase family)
VVTGVGRQIGLEIARALASRGHAVHVTDPDGRLAAQAATELGARAFGSALDVRSLPACRAAASRARRRLGSLEMWVNADTVPGSAPAWDLDERTRQRILDVNLVGVMNGSLAALEVMRAAGRGHVINVAELSGLAPAADQAVYSAAQHGALAFSLATLADLRAAGLSEVSVSCLCVSRKPLSGRGSQKLTAALAELLESPRPLMAIPRWREAIVRARWLWPGPRPLSARVRTAVRDAAAGSSRLGGRSR